MKEGGYLFSGNTDEEHDFVMGLVETHYYRPEEPIPYIHIGGVCVNKTDQPESDLWRWEDGTDITTK